MTVMTNKIAYMQEIILRKIIIIKIEIACIQVDF